MKIFKTLRRIKPHFFHNDSLICSKNNQIYSYSENKGLKEVVNLESSFLDKIFFKSKLLTRLLRIGIRSSQVYKKNFFFFLQKKNLLIQLSY